MGSQVLVFQPSNSRFWPPRSWSVSLHAEVGSDSLMPWPNKNGVDMNIDTVWHVQSTQNSCFERAEWTYRNVRFIDNHKHVFIVLKFMSTKSVYPSIQFPFTKLQWSSDAKIREKSSWAEVSGHIFWVAPSGGRDRRWPCYGMGTWNMLNSPQNGSQWAVYRGKPQWYKAQTLESFETHFFFDISWAGFMAWVYHINYPS